MAFGIATTRTKADNHATSSRRRGAVVASREQACWLRDGRRARDRHRNRRCTCDGSRRGNQRADYGARQRFGATVLSLGPGVQIVLATAPVDLRRGHDGLVSLVQSLWKADAYSGTLFVFLGRRMDRVKILFFSTGGFVVYYKRLEQGRFSMPRVPEGASQIVLDAASLTMLLDGINLRLVQRTTMWRPENMKRDDRKGIDIRAHA